MIARVGGKPDERQAALIEEMIGHEWQARRLEKQALGETGKAAFLTMKLATEYRRLYRLADRDLDRHPARQLPLPGDPVEQPANGHVGKRLAGLHDRFGAPPR